MVVSMPVRSALTPALSVAPWVERGLAAFAVLAAGMAVATRRTGRPTGVRAEANRPEKPSVVNAVP
jgi:hypothetical protein